MTDEAATLRIGLAAVRNPPSVDERLETIDRMLAEAASQGAAIVCFPEAYLPGLRGGDFDVPSPDQQRQEDALATVRGCAARQDVAVVIGMEWQTELGIHNVAFVVDRNGEVLGYQTKNQIPPVEEPYYVADGRRQLFEVEGVTFGITICHEGWRYPEATRWAAMRGAKIVFHPQFTGSDDDGPMLTRWGNPDAPYYEKAMIARAVENTVYFASVNNALRYQDSATSLIGPDGELVAHVPYGEEQLLVCDLDLGRATGFYARRFDASLYPADEFGGMVQDFDAVPTPGTRE